MLLNVTGGFTLGTGTETPTNIVTPSWQISDDLTLVRGGHQYVFGGSFARWSTESHGNVRSPGQFTHRRHADRTRAGGLSAGQDGNERARPGGAEHAGHGAEIPRAVRAGHLESRAALDAELRRPVGAVLPAAARERRGLSVRHGALPGGHQEHGVPERAGGPLFPRRPGLPQPGGHADRLEQLRAARRIGLGSGRATARRRCARRTASRTSS